MLVPIRHIQLLSLLRIIQLKYNETESREHLVRCCVTLLPHYVIRLALSPISWNQSGSAAAVLLGTKRANNISLATKINKLIAVAFAQSWFLRVVN